jgi:hypothetical protein
VRHEAKNVNREPGKKRRNRTWRRSPWREWLAAVADLAWLLWLLARPQGRAEYRTETEGE